MDIEEDGFIRVSEDKYLIIEEEKFKYMIEEVKNKFKIIWFGSMPNKMIDKQFANNSIILADKFRKKDVEGFGNIFFVINIDNEDSTKETEKIMRNIIRIEKITQNSDAKFGKIIDGKQVIGVINIYSYSIINTLKATLIKDKKIQYEYIYDEVCQYLDSEFCKSNCCDFKDDICIEKRNSNITTGCCNRYKNRMSFFLGNRKSDCKYLKNKRCSEKCISCKMFTCNTLEKKGVIYKLNDILLIKCFFNIIQKFIIKYSYYCTKKQVVTRLLMTRI